MKRMKKLFAILMTMAMVMGLSITGFAAPVDVSNADLPKSKITVSGLSSGADTTVKIYQYAFLQYDSETNEYSWRIAEWADDFVKLNAEKTAFEISRTAESELKAAAQTQIATDTKRAGVGVTSCEFTAMPIGGYIIIPSDADADYNPLFAVNTYDRLNSPQNGKPKAIDVNAVAKSDGHTIVKEQNDDFQQIGSTVNYTVKATFPAYTNSDGETLKNFVITDTPSGLDINENNVNVYLGTIDNDNLLTTSDVTINKNPETGVLTVTFNQSVLTKANEGKDIIITYTATVTDTVYNNTVGATSDTTNYGSGDTTGKNGSIQITKVDAEDTGVVLNGAEFKVYDLGINGEWDPDAENEPMTFVYDEDKNAYRPALATELGDEVVKTKENEATDDGKLKIVGLDEGNYHFEETKAPNSYSINEGGLTVTVTEDNEQTIERNFEDTKMASLPSTGGMGTTIFTIAGCVIMISAAGLFFASRRKAN